MKAEDKKDEAGKQEEEVTEEKPNTSRKGKLLLIILIPIIILAIGGGLYFSGFLDRFLKDEKKEEHVEEAKPQGPPAPLYRGLAEFLIDLKTGSSASFIKIDIVLKLPDEKALNAVDANMPIIRDSFISYLRELKNTDLDGSGGLFTLKQELLLRVNKIIAPSVADDLFIQNILTR